MPVDYPIILRNAIQSAKKRDVTAVFRQADPAAGPPYVEKFTDDNPVIWDFNLVFKGAESVLFWSWFRSSEFCNNGLAEFNFPVKNEAGTNDTQLVRFTQSGIPQLTSQSNDVITYKCQVVGREILDEPDPTFVVLLYEQYGDEALDALNALDLTINLEWPT